LVMDFLELPPVIISKDIYYDYIFVIACRLSGYVIAIPTQKAQMTGSKAARLFLERCVWFMGVPNEIMSDQDKFSSQFFKTICRLCGIEQAFSTQYHPDSNGRAERAVQSIVSTLRKILVNTHHSWYDALPRAIWAINSLPGVVHPYSPHRIIFGRDPPILGDTPTLPLNSDISSSAQSWFQEVDLIQNAVQIDLLAQHEKRREKLLRKHDVSFVQTFQLGELVWHQLDSIDRPNKLTIKWSGLHKILKILHNNTYEISHPKHPSKRVLGINLRHYIEPLLGKSIPLHYFHPKVKTPPLDRDIVRIKDHRIRGTNNRKRYEWLVEWKEHIPDSWETLDLFSPHANAPWKKYNRDQSIKIDLNRDVFQFTGP
jgi:hypothetical protein